jgi:hypothetical protein
VEKVEKISIGWANLIARIYEVNPLICTCGKEMKITPFVLHPMEIKRILTRIGCHTEIPKFDHPNDLIERDICQLLPWTEDGFSPEEYLMICEGRLDYPLIISTANSKSIDTTFKAYSLSLYLSFSKATEEGTPQGGPLSPLLSNIMLDDFDKELEKRGLRFARYADDCNIYVKSEKAGQRVMQSVIKFLTTKLKLKVNEQKSAVAQPWNRKFLGFTFTGGKEPGRIAVHESRKRLKDKIRGLTKKMRGNKMTDSIRKFIMPITRGWTNYFSIAEVRSIFESLDGWIRRKIRGILWSH